VLLFTIIFAFFSIRLSKHHKCNVDGSNNPSANFGEHSHSKPKLPPTGLPRKLDIKHELGAITRELPLELVALSRARSKEQGIFEMSLRAKHANLNNEWKLEISVPKIHAFTSFRIEREKVSPM
jgi:hypothetical protein